MFRKMKNKKGFTLIELIVVIAILGILAAIAVPRLMGFQDTARAQANKQIAAQVKNATALLLSSGQIKESSTDTPAYFTLSAAVDDDDEPTGAAKVSNLSGISIPDTKEKLEDLINNMIDDFKLNKIGNVEQVINVKILETSIDVAISPSGTAPSAADYTE